MSKEIIKVPDLGGASEVEVIEVSVAVGDTVEQDQSLVVVESDKASMDIPCPMAGVVSSISVAEGDTVSEGHALIELEIAGATSSPEPVSEAPAVESVAVVAEVTAVANQVNAPSVAVQAVKVPDLGGADSVEIIEVAIAVGDEVEEGDSLLVIESDKASMELPSPAAGKILTIHVKEGDTISEGQLVIDLESNTAGAAPAVEQASVSPAPVVEAPAAEPPAPASTVSAIQAVEVPDLGGADQVDIIEVLVSVGDEVAEGDGIAVMESDKASMELPAPFAGTVTSIDIKVGDQVSEGSAVAQLQVSAAVPAVAQAATAPVKQASTPVSAPAPVAAPAERASSNDGSVYAGPAVRKLARELGVSLDRVKGTGPRGRISKEDLYAYVKKAVNQPVSTGSVGETSGIPQVPEVDFSQFGEVDIQKMSKLHKITAFNMQRSWLNVPHVTQFDDADITQLEVFRASLKPEMERRQNKITPIPFIIKAVAAALQANPAFNASLGADGETIVYKKYVHIGMAVDTPAGLMVPVIRDVDKKGIWDIAAEVRELAAKAKDRKLKPVEMQGGCFTISSLGGIGGQGFTPIVNTPEVGILGVSKLATKPVFINGEFVPRKMLPLSLSYDHRAVNGGDAGRFLTQLGELLSDIRRLTL